MPRRTGRRLKVRNGKKDKYYDHIYLGKDSFFGVPKPRDRLKKALYNLAAQAIDFADGYTVDHYGRRVRFVFRKR